MIYDSSERCAEAPCQRSSRCRLKELSKSLQSVTPLKGSAMHKQVFAPLSESRSCQIIARTRVSQQACSQTDHMRKHLDSHFGMQLFFGSKNHYWQHPRDSDLDISLMDMARLLKYNCTRARKTGLHLEDNEKDMTINRDCRIRL